MFPSEYHLMLKIRSPTPPSCTNLHAGKVYVLLFFFFFFNSGSFAEEVTQNSNCHKPSFFIETSNIVNIILMESL